MATPRLDQLCVEFVKRLPDKLRSAFVPGSGELPDAFNIGAESIVDYVNRALQQHFNNYWQSVGGDEQKFARIFPELIKQSTAVALSSGNYVIASPHKDFFKIIGGITVTGGKYIKPKDEVLYTVYLSQEYGSIITPTANDPVIIQVNDMLAVFPQDLSEQIKFHYIRRPISPVTGNFFSQNGSGAGDVDIDSPFYEHWNNAIVDIAYMKYLQETNQTT